MIRRFALSLSVLALSAAPVLAACSSSSGGGSGSGDDAGAGGTDSGVVNHDSGVTGSDSGGSTDSGTTGDGGAMACPPDSTASFKPDPYVAATGHQKVCQTADITAFVTACGDKGSQNACDAWLTMNVKSEAGAGTACGNCVISPMNNGGTWLDPAGFIFPNYGACLQLTDATNGTACGTAYDNLSACQGVACDSCNGSNMDIDACIMAANQGGCSQYSSALNTSCQADFADGGAGATCSPGAASGSQDPDFTYIIGLVCGQ